MAITLKTIKCPQCGADLSVEEEREKFFCTYCGSQIIMTNDNEHIYRHIDEAEIKKAETERELRIREMEIEERENNKKRKNHAIAYGIALAFIIIGALISIVEPLAGIWGFAIAAWIVLLTVGDSGHNRRDDKKKENKRPLGPNEVRISEHMIFYYEKNYNGFVQLFKSAGFSNVNAVPLHDLSIFNKKQNGQIETITINGNSYEEDDIFPNDANVLITYHSR